MINLNPACVTTANLVTIANALSNEIDNTTRSNVSYEHLDKAFNAIIFELESRGVVTSDFVVYPHE